jgi:hypothetical protein
MDFSTGSNSDLIGSDDSTGDGSAGGGLDGSAGGGLDGSAGGGLDGSAGGGSEGCTGEEGFDGSSTTGGGGAVVDVCVFEVSCFGKSRSIILTMTKSGTPITRAKTAKMREPFKTFFAPRDRGIKLLKFNIISDTLYYYSSKKFVQKIMFL